MILILFDCFKISTIITGNSFRMKSEMEFEYWGNPWDPEWLVDDKSCVGGGEFSKGAQKRQNETMQINTSKRYLVCRLELIQMRDPNLNFHRSASFSLFQIWLPSLKRRFSVILMIWYMSTLCTYTACLFVVVQSRAVPKMGSGGSAGWAGLYISNERWWGHSLPPPIFLSVSTNTTY